MLLLQIADPFRLLHDDAPLNAARRAHEAAGQAVGTHAQRVAAAMVRELLPTAHRIVFNTWEDDHGACQTMLAYVRDETGALLWHGDDFDEHPDAVGLANVEAYGGQPRIRLEWRTVSAIEEALREAYDAWGFDTSDEHAPGHVEANLLELTIPDALTAGSGTPPPSAPPEDPSGPGSQPGPRAKGNTS
jgi:hypothetical protein